MVTFAISSVERQVLMSTTKGTCSVEEVSRAWPGGWAARRGANPAWDALRVGTWRTLTGSLVESLCSSDPREQGAEGLDQARRSHGGVPGALCDPCRVETNLPAVGLGLGCGAMAGN